MAEQLWLGVGVIAATGVIHAAFMSLALGGLRLRAPRKTWGPVAFLRGVVALSFGMLWMMVAHASSIFLWSVALIRINAFPALEDAAFFAMVSYTTLGLGGVTPEPEWRLLPGVIAANGFLLFGFSAAFAVEYSGRLRALHVEARKL